MTSCSQSTKGVGREDEIEYLLQDPTDPDNHVHLSSKPAVLNYLRFADEIRGYLNAADDVLDWGCGLGQMTWLLERRELVVTSYDLGRVPNEKLVIDADRLVLGTKPVLLPFASSAFDAVLSCGVLEHVEDEMASLQEINRVLKPGGFFFTYQLPQRYAYTELINRWRGLWHHKRRYTPATIRKELESVGFRIVRQKRANFLPKNLTGLPPRVRQAYNRIARLVDLLDISLSRIPVLSLLSHSIEVIASKER